MNACNSWPIFVAQNIESQSTIKNIIQFPLCAEQANFQVPDVLPLLPGEITRRTAALESGTYVIIGLSALVLVMLALNQGLQ